MMDKRGTGEELGSITVNEEFEIIILDDGNNNNDVDVKTESMGKHVRSGSKEIKMRENGDDELIKALDSVGNESKVNIFSGLS